MKFFKKTLYTVGALLIFLSFVAVSLTKAKPEIYFIKAISSGAMAPTLWGLTLIASAIFISRSTSFSSFLFKKVFCGIAIIYLLYMTNHFFTISDTVADVKAVLNEDLYIVEGKVSESEINKISSENAEGKIRHSYTQVVTLDNPENDIFYIPLGDEPEPFLDEGATYEIIALPYSRAILEHEELHKK